LVAIGVEKRGNLGFNNVSCKPQIVAQRCANGREIALNQGGTVAVRHRIGLQFEDGVLDDYRIIRQSGKVLRQMPQPGRCLHLLRSLTHFLHSRQQQADKDRDYRDHDQHLDQGEPGFTSSREKSLHFLTSLSKVLLCFYLCKLVGFAAWGRGFNVVMIAEELLHKRSGSPIAPQPLDFSLRYSAQLGRVDWANAVVQLTNGLECRLPLKQLRPVISKVSP
jgi:hypothetical protein